MFSTDDCIFFFSHRNNHHAPARQTTLSFFSGHNQNFPPLKKKCLFPARTKNRYNSTTRQTDGCIFFIPVVTARTAHPSDRRLYFFFCGRNVSFFFPVVIKISRHNKKTANFLPTDDCIFFFSGRNQNFPPLQKKC